MPKVLICASTAIHVNSFHLPYLRFFKEQGFEVHVAVPDHTQFRDADKIYEICMAKSLFSLKNLIAVRHLRNVIKTGGFDLIVTHTALAGAVGRLAVLLAGTDDARVIHTVHGYLFWKGCSLFRNIVYFTPEWLLRGVTDCIVTMNGEDAAAAVRLVKKGGRVFRVSGMGVDAGRFVPATREEKLQARRALSIPESAFVMVYAAEFSKRKNHAELISAMQKLAKSDPAAVLLLCGTGTLQKKIETQVHALGLDGRVGFLDWRRDMEKVYQACDICVSPSICEGLPFNIIEAHLCGLPVVASRIRGHTDLIREGVNGRCYTPGDAGELADTVMKVRQSNDGGKRQEEIRRGAMRYSLDAAFRENTEVYRRFFTV